MTSHTVHENIASSDVISIENALTQLKCFSLEKPLIVTDNGYYSQENMMKFALRNMKFLTLVDPNVTWVREAVDALRETLGSMSSTCPFDPSVCGAMTMRTHEFHQVRQRSRNGKLAGEEETFVRRLYVHVFYSPDNDTRKQLAFRKDLLELKAQVEDGVAEFTKSAQRKIDRYLVCSKKGRGGQVKSRNARFHHNALFVLLLAVPVQCVLNIITQTYFLMFLPFLPNAQISQVDLPVLPGTSAWRPRSTLNSSGCSGSFLNVDQRISILPDVSIH